MAPVRADYFSRVVDGRLADLFESIAEAYDKARSDGERQFVVFVLGGTVRSAREYITYLEASGEPPLERLIDARELLDGGNRAEEKSR